MAPPTSPPPASPAITPSPSPSAVPTNTPLPTPTATPTLAPTATPTLAPTATPDPFVPFYIETLRARQYGTEGIIEIGAVWVENEAYTRYAIRYPSDGLVITGYMDVPKGPRPFPVVILNHGYYDPPRYRTGDGTMAASDFLARRGFLTIAPDYRVYGGSDDGNNDFRVGYIVDVVNLVHLLPTLPPEWTGGSRVGMWGHSMGGGVTLGAIVISDRVSAAVIYGGVSGDMAAYWNHIHAMWHRDEMNGAAERLGRPDERPDAYARMSSLNYVENVTAAVSIHHGTADEQVPYPWSEELRDRLLAAGKPVEHYSYPGALHNFAGADWSLLMERTSAFFDLHLRGTTSAQ